MGFDILNIFLAFLEVIIFIIALYHFIYCRLGCLLTNCLLKKGVVKLNKINVIVKTIYLIRIDLTIRLCYFINEIELLCNYLKYHISKGLMS